MDRLTYKNYIEEYEVNFEKNSEKQWSISESDTHIKVTGEPIDKLGELEDVLEKYGIENLEEYIPALIEARKLAIEESKSNFDRYIQETIKREKLEQELAELKQNTPNCSECKHLNKKIELNIKKKLMSENNQLRQELIEIKQKAIVLEKALQKLAEIGGKDE